ncbi:MAG: type II toxin-antitoxin system RelB/DinJ family antitoxin [Defluviitaleaceae bacterium]|nr:type II toxin-antitoxin system RelB/DinJ family antitoxin [Defluviitaleaceae bacterium]
MAQTSINIRMDEDLKRDFDNLCDDFGLSMTAAFTVFAKTVVRRQMIPFEISANVPNAVTVAAIEEVQEMKRNPHLRKGFDSVEALFEELESDDN